MPYLQFFLDLILKSWVHAPIKVGSWHMFFILLSLFFQGVKKIIDLEIVSSYKYSSNAQKQYQETLFYFAF